MSDPTLPPSDPPPLTPVPTPLFYSTAGPITGVVDPVERQWGMIGHLSGLAGYLVPFGNVVGPLVVWQMKKDVLPFAAQEAKEALNFHITIAIAMVISLALLCLVVGVFLLPIVGIYALVMTILGAVKANNGLAYRYPFTLRLVK